jgi:hypothetical protein
MAHIDLICFRCKHAYQIETDSLFKDDEKNCPECGSDSYRQTFASYRRNGPLVDPKWANLGGGGCTHFG